jgi:cytochrome c oxidase subunit 2
MSSRNFLIAFTAAASLFVASTSFASSLPTSAPRPWQTGFQSPASPIAEGIHAFHDDLRLFLAGILGFVRYVLAVCLQRFGHRRSTNHRTVTRLVHASTLEILWTIFPALVLIVIAIPSFSLLYSVDEILEPLFTVKVIGHQWYWTYEFLDPEVVANLYNASLSALPTTEGADALRFEPQGSSAFDSYLLSEDELDNGLTSIRLLTVDNHLFLPTERHIRTRITSADVLHSWAVPALGVKVDACPGRLNQASLYIKREGLYYGQCSEICGVNHGFRPIGIVSHDFFAGLTPTALDVEPLLAALQAIARD